MKLSTFAAALGLIVSVLSTQAATIVAAMKRTLILLVFFAGTLAQAQTPATLENQIAVLSNRISALQGTVTALTIQVALQNAENASLQTQITLVQSTESMQASNLAALTKSFTPVQSAVTATQGIDTAQSAAIAAIQAQLTLVASNPALQLGPFVKVDPNAENGLTGPNIVFKGANIHIVSGSGSTNDNGGTLTGLGNLVIGYAENTGVGPWGTVTNLTRTGSHNLMIGQYNSFNSFGGLVAGEFSQLYGPNSSILGGTGNGIYAPNSSIVGGYTNSAYGFNGVIVGGWDNAVGGATSVVVGGYNCYAGGTNSSSVVALGGDGAVCINPDIDLSVLSYFFPVTTVPAMSRPTQ